MSSKVTLSLTPEFLAAAKDTSVNVCLLFWPTCWADSFLCICSVHRWNLLHDINGPSSHRVRLSCVFLRSIFSSHMHLTTIKMENEQVLQTDSVEQLKTQQAGLPLFFV